MLKNIILVAAGSAIGGVLRYLVTYLMARLFKCPLPLGVLISNVAGCFVIALISSRIGAILPPQYKLLLTTGLCGGWTTFSTFSLDSVNMLISGQYLRFALNVLSNLVLGMGAIAIGIRL